MTPLMIGLLIIVFTVLVLATGLPIAFGLGAVALAFMIYFDGWHAVHFVPETIFAGLDDFREHLGGRLCITVPTGVGSAKEISEVDAALVGQAIDRLKSRAS